MNKYDKFETALIHVPVQFGHKSKRPRRCKKLGWLGSLIREPYWFESYYRIDKREKSAGRFFYERRWKGEKDGTINKNGKTWYYLTYISYSDIPQEIKDEINRKED